jgi:DNA-binding NarL/FixJ family response regulator
VSKLRKWTAEEERRLLELCAAGKSPYSIGKEFKRTESAILNRIHILKKREEDRADGGSDCPSKLL